MFQYAVLLLYSSSSALAFQSIDTPSSVDAGTDFQVTINNDLGSPESIDASFEDYRIYLSIISPNSTHERSSGVPACYLVNSTSVGVTNVTIQIPASVGPSGAKTYAIAAMEFDANGTLSEFVYSPAFVLTGGSGGWTQLELDGRMVGNADSIPCSAYDCSRQCSQKFYNETIDARAIEDYHNTYNCWVSCQGTTYKSWASTEEQYWAAMNGTLSASGGGGSERSTSSPTMSGTAGINSQVTNIASTTSTSASGSLTSTSSQTTKSMSVRSGADLWVMICVFFALTVLLYTL